jgi:hypothetical protein
VSILVCEYIPKTDRGNERISRPLVDNLLAIEHADRVFGCRPGESELA